ncbi:Aste57867_22729 [Aphanomyces stellatus]|uniref:Aste57867_22729 protein n=1 Tax=Aphanomyces stellatus TaxID=120398 RepID=A0A485LKS3_9STRA|nr:hypothetical protein As57867_022659 [Aphanomyces stellatus]VFT99382.1 Aste57867_22729 [Aphanomyces stellatus]
MATTAATIEVTWDIADDGDDVGADVVDGGLVVVPLAEPPLLPLVGATVVVMPPPLPLVGATVVVMPLPLPLVGAPVVVTPLPLVLLPEPVTLVPNQKEMG